MATYAIGDIQGCYEEFARMLDQIDFRKDRDRLWLLGDLINRGPDNVSVVRRVMALGDAAIIVLGNHDLHYLAVHRGGHTPNRSDTFTDLLESPIADEASDWYRQQRLFYRDKSLGYVMAHAGVPHLWRMKQARTFAEEVEAVVLKSMSKDPEDRYAWAGDNLDFQYEIPAKHASRDMVVAQNGTQGVYRLLHRW